MWYEKMGELPKPEDFGVPAEERVSEKMRDYLEAYGEWWGRRKGRIEGFYVGRVSGACWILFGAAAITVKFFLAVWFVRYFS